MKKGSGKKNMLSTKKLSTKFIDIRTSQVPHLYIALCMIRQITQRRTTTIIKCPVYFYRGPLALQESIVIDFSYVNDIGKIARHPFILVSDA